MELGYKKLYLGDALKDAESGTRQEVICPGTEERVGEIAWASEKDAAEALASAQKGFESWRRLTPAERGEWMAKLREAVEAKRDMLRECVMLEQGKTWGRTMGDVQTVISALSYFPEQMALLQTEALPDDEGNREHALTYEPLGVAVAFLAWNFPLLNLGFKLGPALAAGCSIVIKPSPETPLSAYALGEICEDIGFPAGVINILTGPDETVGRALAESRIPALLTLIGSEATGRRVMRNGATSIKHYSMELGGNAPVLIFEDADLERAVKTVAGMKFGNAGQICVAPNRVFVHRSKEGEFLEALLAKTAEAKPGFGRDSGATMEPLISSRARERVHGLVCDAIDGGAELLCGGSLKDMPEKGYFYPATVLRGVTPEMRIFHEEIFGPVVSVLTFENEDDAVRAANDTEAGLASYIFTADLDRARRIAGELQFGEVQINGAKYGIDLPHIGIKQSGIGCDCSPLALHEYLVRKRITVTK